MALASPPSIASASCKIMGWSTVHRNAVAASRRIPGRVSLQRVQRTHYSTPTATETSPRFDVPPLTAAPYSMPTTTGVPPRFDLPPFPAAPYPMPTATRKSPPATSRKSPRTATKKSHRFEVPPLTAAPYRWQRSPGKPATLRRLGVGTEAWVGLRKENEKGQYDIYFDCDLRLSQPSSLFDLKQRIAAAMVDARFHHPEIACTAAWEGDNSGTPWIEYTPPTSNSAALDWARSAIHIRTSSEKGPELREDLERRRRARPTGSTPSVTWHLAAAATGEHSCLPAGTAVTILGHFNHIYWDGGSGRVCFGEILKQIGKTWHMADDFGLSLLPEYAWGKETANLSEPVLDALQIEPSSLGEDFVEARDEFIGSLIDSGKSWGLSVVEGTGVPRVACHTFSQEESEAMIRVAKRRVGPKYSISHLGHTAVVLALLKARPLTSDDPDDTELITPLPVDGRRYLKDQFVTQQYGCCQAGAVVRFPDLKSWAVDLEDHDAVMSMMDRGCRHVKESYDYWTKNNFQVAVNVSKDHFLSSLLSKAPMPFSGSSIPVFATDGRIDRYVPNKVVDSHGHPVFDVEDFAVYVHIYGPDIVTRMESFGGRTKLSLCYNDGHFDSQQASDFLQSIVDILHLVISSDK